MKSHKNENASTKAENVSESSDSDTTPDNTKRARKCVTRQSGSQEGSSSPPMGKDSFFPTGDQQSIGSNDPVKSDEFVEKSVSRQATDFETWRTLEKSLFEMGQEMFGKNWLVRCFYSKIFFSQFLFVKHAIFLSLLQLFNSQEYVAWSKDMCGGVQCPAG